MFSTGETLCSGPGEQRPPSSLGGGWLEPEPERSAAPGSRPPDQGSPGVGRSQAPLLIH